MDISRIESSLKYITNVTGKRTEVIIPVEVWEEVIRLLRDSDSGLFAVDEHESQQSLLADLQESLTQANAGNTHPVSELWNGLEP